MQSLKILCVVCFLSVANFSRHLRADDTPPPDRKTLEEKFTKTMTNVRLTGFYTMGESTKTPKTDQYSISKVEKSEGDKWIITTVMKYGDRGINIPLEIPIFWAGDTPVISVTDLKIMGMGPFTARVMIYGDHYAGTWSHGGHGGGYMWGKLEPADGPTTKPAEEPKK
jgi:hypothetical protein